MRRFFYLTQNILQDRLVIVDKDEIHHILDVLRLGRGAKVNCFDGKGREIIGSIKDTSHKKITIEIEKIIKFKADEFLRLTLACALPKKAKMDYIVEKTTELGIYRIIPLKTKRTIVDLDRQKEISRISRWRKIALNSAKQSGRRELPIIESVMTFEDILPSVPQYDLAVIPNLFDKERQSLKNITKNPKQRNVLILIGPEGDFTPEELDLAKKAGCVSVSLGNLTFKVDTAAIALVAFLRLTMPNKNWS